MQPQYVAIADAPQLPAYQPVYDANNVNVASDMSVAASNQMQMVAIAAAPPAAHQYEARSDFHIDIPDGGETLPQPAALSADGAVDGAALAPSVATAFAINDNFQYSSGGGGNYGGNVGNVQLMQLEPMQQSGDAASPQAFEIKVE